MALTAVPTGREAEEEEDGHALEIFRGRVRRVIEDTLRPKSDGGPIVTDVAVLRDLQCRLFEAGLAGITFPRELGGAGLTERYQRTFDEVAGGYAYDNHLLEASLGICGPALMHWGNDEQRRTHIPRILRADEIWCQLFSEPSAGSDLAGLRTTGVRDGEGWVLNGQKVWNTFAHESDFGLCIARTDRDVAKHAGLSAFIVDMHAPAVEVRPIRQITGDSRFDEVFFSDVRLGPDALIGRPGDGWRVALSVMLIERRMFGLHGLEVLARYADRAIAAAQARGNRRPGCTADIGRHCDSGTRPDLRRHPCGGCGDAWSRARARSFDSQDWYRRTGGPRNIVHDELGGPGLHRVDGGGWCVGARCA